MDSSDLFLGTHVCNKNSGTRLCSQDRLFEIVSSDVVITCGSEVAYVFAFGFAM